MSNKKLNALGAFEDLELFDSKGNRVYEFSTGSNGNWIKSTYDSKGNLLTYEDSDGFWTKSTYDSNRNQLTFEDSYGYWTKRTYDSNNNVLTYENSDVYWSKSTYDLWNQLTFEDSKGYWSKSTYDSDGNELTFEDSYGEKRGFDIPEFTMGQLVEKIGHDFKIIK